MNISFVNDKTGQPAVYFDRPDLNSFTLEVTSDAASPPKATFVRLRFPTRIFAIADIAKIKVTTPGWTAVAAGPTLTLTPVSGEATLPLKLGLTDLSTSNTAATNDVLQVFFGPEAPTTKIFLMRYPAEAGDLTKALLAEFRPATIDRTPKDFDRIENVLTLQLSNAVPGKPLATSWQRTPTISLSFVYGDDIGSLTPADPPDKDPHSALNIAVEPIATYKDGEATYEWTVSGPDTDGTPVWKLTPTKENQAILGAAAGASAAFRISNLSTDAPSGITLAYLQFSDFPGFSDTFITRQLTKQEPVDSIVFFDGSPAYVAALGDQATLRWQTVNMARVTLLKAGQALPGPFDAAHGSWSGPIDRTTDFELQAYKRADDTAPAHIAQWTAHVPDVQIGDFSADHTTVAAGAAVTLSWTTKFARGATISSDTLPQPYAIDAKALPTGSHPFFPRKPTTYRLSVTGQGALPDRTLPIFVLETGWSRRAMGLSPDAGGGPILFSTTSGLILAGGQSQNAVFQSLTGDAWTQVGNGQFPARNAAGGCFFNGKCWIMGGVQDAGPSNDVWNSPDGVTWTQVTAAAGWSPRSQFACVAFGGKLWVMGGLDANLAPLGDIWSSSDGVTWTQVTATAPWSARSGAAVAEHQGSLYLFGGLLKTQDASDELWSSADGVTWRHEPGSIHGGGAPARQQAALFSLKGKLYLFGGVSATGDPLRDFREHKTSGWGVLSGPSRTWAVTSAGLAIWRDAFWIAGGYDADALNATVWSFFPG